MMAELPTGQGRRRLIIFGVVLAASLLLEVVVHLIIGIDVVYSHFFYVPIVLAGIWYGRRAIPVALGLGLVLIAVTWAQSGAVTVSALGRALMFLVVAAVIGLAAERLRWSGPGGLHSTEPEFSPDLGTDDLILALQNRNADTRYEAAVALGKREDPAAIEPLRSALSDPEPGVRWVAMEALGAIGRPALPVLIELLASDDVDVRWGAAIALGDIGDREAVEALAARLEDTDRYVRTRAALALAAIGGPALPALAAVVEGGSAEGRWAAALALGKAGLEEGVPPLSRLLRDGDTGVRWKAAEALGEIGGLAAVPPLITALGDDEGEVREAAASALAGIGAPAAGPLVDALRVRERWFGAVDALRGMGDAARPALLAALERRNRWVRIGAAMILGEAGDERGVDALVAALEDDDAEVRAAAREILTVGLKKEIHNGI
ncbi:HEAT repeat domain-containing protein [Methanofollis fontis]|nr:HEAT repeat domain-containing protein [Methanofollis fontis]